jgi:hypothetical protein
MEPGNIAQFLSVGVAFCAFFFTVSTYVKRAKREEVERLQTAVVAAQKDIEWLKLELRHVPNDGDVHEIRLSLSRLEGNLAAMDERLKPLASISERMQDFLMESRQ